MNSTDNANSSANAYVFLAIARFAGGIPIEHPLKVCISKHQVMPFQSSHQVVQSIMAEKGFKGFYAGFWAGIGGRLGKNVCRWVGIKAFHDIWDSVFPSSDEKREAKIKIATAGSVAAMETLLTPITRLFNAAVNEGGYGALFKDKDNEKKPAMQVIRSLFSGSQAIFGKQMISWSVFISANHYSKHKIVELDPQNKHPILARIGANVFVAASLTLFGMPFDFLKTHIQLNPDLQKMPIHKVMKTLLGKYKIRHLYAGTLFNFIYTNIHALLGGAILDKIMQPKYQYNNVK